MTPAHSPEPWRIESSHIVGADGERFIAVDCYGGADSLTQAEAERIVACVNFCRGIPTDELMRFGHVDKPAMGFVLDHLLRMEQVRAVNDFDAYRKFWESDTASPLREKGGT